MNDPVAPSPPLYDVVAVNIASGKVALIVGWNKPLQGADAAVKMAIIRRGVEKEFYATVPAGRFTVGDTYLSPIPTLEEVGAFVKSAARELNFP